MNGCTTKRLHRELAMLALRTGDAGERAREACQRGEGLADDADLVDALQDEAPLRRRIVLINMWLAQPRR